MLTPGDSACDVVADAQSAGLAGPINGLQAGKVIPLQSDPQGGPYACQHSGHRQRCTRCLRVRPPSISNNSQLKKNKNKLRLFLGSTY